MFRWHAHKRPSFDGDDHGLKRGDKCVRPTMSNCKRHVGSEVVEPVQPMMADKPLE